LHFFSNIGIQLNVGDILPSSVNDVYVSEALAKFAFHADFASFLAKNERRASPLRARHHKPRFSICPEAEKSSAEEVMREADRQLEGSGSIPQALEPRSGLHGHGQFEHLF
jgi:hypothetical protein